MQEDTKSSATANRSCLHTKLLGPEVLGGTVKASSLMVLMVNKGRASPLIVLVANKGCTQQPEPHQDRCPGWLSQGLFMREMSTSKSVRLISTSCHLHSLKGDIFLQTRPVQVFCLFYRAQKPAGGFHPKVFADG